MNWFEELGPDPWTEATNRYIVMFREQWQSATEIFRPQDVRQTLLTLPLCKHEYVFISWMADPPGGVGRQCKKCFRTSNDITGWDPITDPAESLPQEILLDWEAIEQVFDEAVATAGVSPKAESSSPKPKHTNEYLAHITSNKWRSIRSRVLTRCGGICEGCLINRATEVHHMNYLTLGDELCYDLRALCPACHDKADNVRKQRR